MSTQNDVNFISEYYDEYVSNIVRYQNYKKSSIFVRYYNIESQNSEFNKKTLATINNYGPQIKFKVYDYTPLVSHDGLMESSQDLSWFQFIATGNVGIYTIHKPKFADIIAYPYLPENKYVCYRVKSIEHVFATRDKNNLFTKLEIEPAPIDNLKQLNILEYYTYYIPLEKNIPSNSYNLLLEEIKILEFEFFILLSEYFDCRKELFFTIYEGRKYYNIITNQKILNFFNTFREFFTSSKFIYPFGVVNYNDITQSNAFISSDNSVIYSNDIMNFDFINNFIDKIDNFIGWKL